MVKPQDSLSPDPRPTGTDKPQSAVHIDRFAHCRANRAAAFN